MNRALLFEAIEELQRRKLRTGLTLLGMVFGVAAIVAMLAVGEGSKREALRLVAELGLDNIIVESKTMDYKRKKDLRSRSLGLSEADAQAALNVVPGARSVALRKEIKVDQLVYQSRVIEGRAYAISNAYMQHSGLQMGKGRWFSEEGNNSLAAVCVLGPRLAKELFGDQAAVGEKIKLNHVWLEVVGVLADRTLSKSEFEGIKLGLDDERLFVPWATAQARFYFPVMDDEADAISLQLDGKVAPEAAARVLQQVVEDRHAGADDTDLIVPMGLYRQNQQTQKMFTIVMSSIAAVSLLVGGIGIMNIMLANVLERKKEIGLKRALGARKRDVIDQFLAEALVIASSGALLGLLLGAVAAYSIAALAGWSVAWSPLSLAAAVAACIAVGLGFGVFPARKAAELDPIAALRSD
ncbi:ABC transporter permease [Undibacterium crateris]|uniref:ABC transporter permease n=1 Tax=Undibacterium crateris TaxID=2528175 RepID=UPI00138A56FB|nr:ABC transporter permease [Undibacterium crateris]NDI84045.1 FtsX-like permease family protein [Undibacterium crateris]